MAPAEGVQDLRSRRPHPRSLTRCHDHDVQHHADIRVAPARRPALDYRRAGDCARSRDGGLQPDQARLRPGERPDLPLARSLCRLRQRAIAQGAQCARRHARLASAHATARLRAAARARRGRGRRRRDPRAHVRLGGRAARPHRAGAAAARADDRRCRSHAFAGAGREHREALRRDQRGVPRRSPAAQPAAPPQGGGQARGRARRDVLRPPRCGAARPGRPLGDHLAVRRRGRLRRAQGAPAGRAVAGAPPARREQRPRRRHRPGARVPERHRPLTARKLPPLFGARHGAPMRAGKRSCTTAPARRSGTRPRRRSPAIAPTRAT